MKSSSVFFSILVAAFSFCAPANAAKDKIESPATVIVKAENIKKIKKDDLQIYLPVSGVTTAQDTYDVYAPFDGRIEEIRVELFELIDKKTILAQTVSSEMAAVIDSSAKNSKRHMERRWGNHFKYHNIKIKTRGIICNVYVKPMEMVHKGDRLFTIAKKVVIVGKNTKPLYSKLKKNLSATMMYGRDKSFRLDTVLTNFLPLGDDSLYYRMWLEAKKLKNKIKIGERFNGFLFVGQVEDSWIVPTNALIKIKNKNYLVIEAETGLSSHNNVEILRFGNHYIIPENLAEK